MKKDDLVRVIRTLVKQEIKKELPIALAQVFQTLMAGKVSSPEPAPKAKEAPPKPELTDEPEDEMTSLKSQLQEMFSGGTTPITKNAPPKKKFTNNPLLNEILNQTKSTSEFERANGQSASRFAMTPAAMLASEYANGPSTSPMGIGEMMNSDELSFTSKIPGMPGHDTPVVSHIPTNGGQMLAENQAPLAGLPEAVSALDMKNHPALPDTIKNALKRDYRSLIKAMDKKKV